jgi:hypothetical protein
MPYSFFIIFGRCRPNIGVAYSSNFSLGYDYHLKPDKNFHFVMSV